MVRLLTRRLPTLLILALLLSALAPPMTHAQSEPDAPNEYSDSLCTGDPNANYTGPCGPSLTLPAWSDAVGWDASQDADNITLFDLDGDGKDELIGQGPHGLLVNTWSNDLGQWVQASDLTKPLPFPGGSIYGNVHFGLLSEGLRGAVALPGSSLGIETWAWNPGDGSIGSGYWTLLDQNGPSPFGSGTEYFFSPAYYSTLQFVSEPLGGTEYGIIARGSDGIHFCAWGGSSWSCHLATSAFNDALITDLNTSEQWPNNLAEYYWDTIQLADLDSATPGPELFGLDNTSQSLVIYRWDSSSRQFVNLNPSGNAPFWSPQGQWLNTLYSSTIQAVQLNGPEQPMSVIARGRNGLEWHSLNDSGCGGHAAPCWKNNTSGQGALSDYSGYGQGQYAGTLRFVDLDGDGIDELIIRSPSGELTSWGLHKNAGWYQLSATGPQLTAGPADDPLWSNATYYGTINAGVVSDDQRPTLIMRGKYGIRTFQFWNQSGWWRPYPYGFQSFSTQAEINAYELLNNYLNLAGNNTIRDSYTSPNSSDMSTYLICLGESIASGATMPPTQTCSVIPPQEALSNPNNVTAADWQAMVKTITLEVSLARDVDGYFNTSMAGILQQLFDLDQTEFEDYVNHLFPNPPDLNKNGTALMFNLFIGFGEATSIFTGEPEVNAALHIASVVVGAMASMQTANNPANTYSGDLSGLQVEINQLGAEAIQRNTDLFQYVVQDRGLMSLYGALVADQYWEIQAPGENAAISIGEYQTAALIFQAMLPLYWQVWVCETVSEECNDQGVNRHTSKNILMVADDWWSYVANHDAGQISDSDPLFERVFDTPPAECQLGGTDASSNWTYSNNACSLGVPVTTVLNFDGAWNILECWVYRPAELGHTANYRCGQGPPDGYGPPGS